MWPCPPPTWAWRHPARGRRTGRKPHGTRSQGKDHRCIVDADSDPSPERPALSNLAFAHADSEIRSSYDTAEPDPAAIADASRTDSPLPSAGTPRAGRRVSGQEQAVPSRPSPSADAAVFHTYRTDLSKVRALVMQQARVAGLTESRATDMVLAVSEVAANTLRHTDSSGTLAIWHDQNEMVCEIHDEGRITDPRAGQLRPAADATGGHGLWLVYQVCDLVELRSDQTGTTIRMHMKINPPGLSE
jgi:anti-sigma regulatory factor (Ser/Thr protein kinase)